MDNTNLPSPPESPDSFTDRKVREISALLESLNLTAPPLERNLEGDVIVLSRRWSFVGLELGRYGVSRYMDAAYQGFLGAQIRRIFLDGYGV
ncbi:hypothetical protein Tco_1306310 [Tanacetum coccineum]